jgi:hypothetical protein
MKSFQSVVLGIATAIALSGCSQKEPGEPPLAKPSLALSHDAAPLGSPIEIRRRREAALDQRELQGVRPCPGQRR